MIKKYTLIRVDCDYCDRSFPTKKDAIHFQNEEDANKTVLESGWTRMGEYYLCPTCSKGFREAELSVKAMFQNRTDEN